VILPQAWAGDSNYAAGQSAELTKYLHTHRLPLVTAQLLANPDGSRQVVLSGFTATDFGKQDAATKSRSFLNDSTIAISNRIKVRPELESQNSPSGSLSGDTGAEASGGDSGQGGNPEAASPPANPNGVNYQNQSQRDIQSYNAQQQQAYRQQPGMGGMGGGSGLTFGSGGMGLSMGGGGLGALLGLLGGAGGSRSYGLGSSGNGYGSQGYGSSGYGAPGYGSSGYGSPGYGSPGYGSSPYGAPPGYPSNGPPLGGDPSGGNPSSGYPY